MANTASCLPVGWKDLYQIALLETSPEKISNQIGYARNAILDRLEDLLTSSFSAEHQELNDALRRLRGHEENVSGKHGSSVP